MPLIFEKLENGHVYDTKILSKLGDLAAGVYNASYSLGPLVSRFFGHSLDKDTWRTGYGDLRGVPLAEWAEGARKYAIDDAIWTWKLAKALEGFVKEHREASKVETRAAFALRLMTCRGILTDQRFVDALEEKYSKKLEWARFGMVVQGLMRATPPKKKLNAAKLFALYPDHPRTPTGKPKWTKKERSRVIGRLEWREETLEEDERIYEWTEWEYTKNKAALEFGVAMAYGGEPPLTDKGNIATDAAAIRKSGWPAWECVTEYTHAEKMLSTYVKAFRHPKVCASYNILMNTGRTSSSQPNIQNIPGEAGLRECFVPRPGHYFVSIDYDTLELRTLAQVQYDWFGRSKLGDALNDGVDPHLLFGSKLMGISYQKAFIGHKNKDKDVKHHRTLAKICNFGYPGGLGAQTFVDYAQGYGVELTPEEASKLKEDWLQAWDMDDYFKYIQRKPAGYKWIDGEQIKLYDVTIPRINRTRGGCTYSQGCNYPFQGLAAHGAKDVLWELACHSYDMGQPVFKPVAFIHDEVVFEVPIKHVQEACLLATAEMCRVMQETVPDVKITASPQVMTRWTKSETNQWNVGF
jgi:DNA polymerase-1